MGLSVDAAKQVPLAIVQEALLAKRQEQDEYWRRARFIVTNICRSNGADVSETDFFLLPGESRTKLDIELLKKLSSERTT